MPIRVVISTHVGTPWGGVSTLYEDLFRSRFSDLVELYYVDNHPGAGAVATSGQASLHNLISALAYYLLYLRTLRRVKPQVVHIATSPGLAFLKQGVAAGLARIFGSRVILAPHCSYSRLIPGRGPWRSYGRFVLRLCDGLLALSREWLVVQEWLPSCLVEYMPNAIDLKPYRALPRPRAIDRDPAVRILYLGHIGRDKGSFDLVEAGRALNGILPAASWQIEFRGESLRCDELRQVAERIRELGLEERMKIEPPVFNAEKAASLAHADVFVLPSYHEGMPVSLIEAMASGLPVVATSVGGIPELVVGEETGILVEPGQPGQLAEALASLICDCETRVSMGLRGRQRALACHDLDARVPDLVRFHEAVAVSSRRDLGGNGAQ